MKGLREPVHWQSSLVSRRGPRIPGYSRISAKAGARWQTELWLGKTVQNDVNIIATAQGLFLTRSVRRLPDRRDLNPAGEIVTLLGNTGVPVLVAGCGFLGCC